MKVFVYYNLHKKLWSIKAMEGPNKGRVIKHSQHVVLENPTPKVSEAGRQRVLAEGRKNVHAGIVGNLFSTGLEMTLNPNNIEITYNPYKYKTFVLKHSTSVEFSNAEYCYMSNRKVYIF